MELTTTRVGTGRLPMRQLAVLALIALLIASALAVYVGTHQQRLPAPFGPAANGSVVYAEGGDIYSADPDTGVTKPIVSGSGFAFRPRFSHDGTRMAYEWKAAPSDAKSDVFVAASDGSDVRRVTTEPVTISSPYLGESWNPYEFSPDGSSLLIAANGGILIARSDGTGVDTITISDLPGYVAVTEPSFRPPDGNEVLFVGKESGTSSSGLYVVDRATRGVRTLVAPRPGHDLGGPKWSPDGSRIAYWAWTDDPTRLTVSTHVILPDGTGDRRLPAPVDVYWNAGSEWSNDGTRLLVAYGHSSDYTQVRLAIAPADGSAVGKEIESTDQISRECCMTWEWAPDDSWIIIRPVDSTGSPLQELIVDPVEGTTQKTSWTTTGEPTVQRVAP